jgi:hypothetical protein
MTRPMKIVPPARVDRFEQLEPGELFVHIHGGGSCYAIKTSAPSSGDRSNMVLLGPTFPYGADESLLIPWQSSTVVTFGHDYSIVLPVNPTAWFLNGDRRKPVCLAVSGEEIYVCTNGGPAVDRFLQCFVNLKTGEIIENQLPSITAYTNAWEIVFSCAHLPPLTLLKYPCKPD